jgi:hypothetical protein
MTSRTNIIEQLNEQGIEFEILQEGYNPSPDSELNKVVKNWMNRFVGKRTAPNLENYLWHIFSFNSSNSLEGEQAIKELSEQYDVNTLIFNEQRQYLILCKGRIPKIEMEDFCDDLYISHHNMKWTYVIPHEIPNIGPFFSTGN